MFAVIKKRVTYETHGGSWNKYGVVADETDIFRGTHYQLNPEARIIAEFGNYEEAKDFASQQPEDFVPLSN